MQYCVIRKQNERRILCSQQKNCVEITFYQAVKLSKLAKKEKPTLIFENHFECSKLSGRTILKKSIILFILLRDTDTSNLSVRKEIL